MPTATRLRPRPAVREAAHIFSTAGAIAAEVGEPVIEIGVVASQPALDKDGSESSAAWSERAARTMRASRGGSGSARTRGDRRL